MPTATDALHVFHQPTAVDPPRVRGLPDLRPRSLATDLMVFEAPGQARDSRGRWTDTGGGPAALHDDGATIRDTFGYEDPQTGLRAEVRSISGREAGARGTTYVEIKIYDRNDNVVGNAHRAILPADQRTVRHDGMALEPGIQGQGFATRFNAHAEASYRAHGIEKITTNANIDVGGYSHARAGYDFNGHRGTVEARAMVFGIKNPGSKAEIDRVISNPHATPADFAMIGHTPGAKTWAGKEIMLGSQWPGVKTL